jgi:hypothetical protein
MSALVLGTVLEIGRSLIDRFLPDPAAKAEAEMTLIKMAADGELKQVVAQLEINAKEAMSPSLWVSGWRPYFGWVGGTAFLYVGLLKPILGWVSAMKGWPQPPEIDTDFLWVVISGMLGIGGLRTVEKARGVAK